MKIRLIILLLPVTIFQWSCEDTIYPDLPEAESVIVIDAWINNKQEQQVININKTVPYLKNRDLPGVNGALVSITDNEGKEFIFNGSGNDGEYLWTPDSLDPELGRIGNEYLLTVSVGETVFQSISKMNRVPEIDSISFRFEKGNDFFPDSYFASIYAKDFTGPSDTYWIKAYKNGKFLNKPSEINIAFDAGFSAGNLVDGITFIQPIRDGVNPFELDEDDNILSPYSPGDSIYVELHSITNESFYFLNEVIIQTDRPGGFAELFAQPLSNVPTNIENVTGAGKVIGFFNMSAVSEAARYLDPAYLPEQE